jgi:catecholate siderophore receptor
MFANNTQLHHSSLSPKSVAEAAIKRPLSLRLAHVAKDAIPLVGALSLAATSMPAASAEVLDLDNGAGVETVTVTGTKKRQNPYGDEAAPYKVDRSASDKITLPLLDFPKSISVISKEAIRDSGALSFRDLVRTQPGVTLGTGEGGNAYGDRIFFRGFDARNDVYVDGLRDPGVGSREIFAVEQVEILKGPASTFGGRGTTGGAVSLISKAPQNKFFGDIEITGGSDNTKRATVEINTPVTDQISVRANGLYHEGDVAGRDHVNADRWGLAGAINYRPSQNLAIDADYYHLTTDGMADWGIPYDTKTNRPFAVSRGSFYGVLARDYLKTFADIYSLKGTYTLGQGVRLKSVTRYGNTGNAYIASAPEAPDSSNPNPALWTVRANPKQRDAVTTYIANQTDASVDFDLSGTKHNLVSGFEISTERVRNRAYQNLNSEVLGVILTPATIVQNLYAPNAYAPWPFPKSLSSVRTSEVGGQALYAMDTITFSPQWLATAGVRYDRYQLDVKTLTSATGVTVPAQNHVSFWNGQAGLTYKPRDNGAIYVSYGSSSNPSGEQLDASAADYGGLAATNANLQPERNTIYETGTKWNVANGHLNVTAALFRIEKENARVAVGAGTSATIVLDGVQRVDGVELGASGKATDYWDVIGGLTLIDARTVASPVASQIGAKFPNVAKTSAGLTNKFKLDERISFGATSTYNSRRYGGTTTANITYIPSFWRHDLFANFKVTERLELSVNALNVTDKLYYDALYRSATPFTYVAPGRAVLVKLDYEF